MLGMRLNSSYQGSYIFSSEGLSLVCHDLNRLSEARVKHSVNYKPNILHHVGTTIVTEQLLVMKGKPKKIGLELLPQYLQSSVHCIGSPRRPRRVSNFTSDHGFLDLGLSLDPSDVFLISHQLSG